MKYGQINLTVNCENDGKHKRRNGIKCEFFFHSTSKMVLHTRTHLNASELKGNVGMFDSIMFDNSKVSMFDDWNVSFLRKKKT
jgi:hypothetical protein